MNTSDILCVIKGHYLLSKTVRGVFSPDTLPSRVNTYPSVYVCNTDPSHLPGQHWVVVWMETPRKAEFFLAAWVNCLNIMMIESKTL